MARACVVWGARASDGENVPDVMYRVNLKAGQIHLLPVVFKTLAAGVLIGTGGSVGAEGPVIVAGAGTASRIGRWLRTSPNRLRTLAGCGAAAGLSAAFNAPIAGVIFGVEKILGTAGDLALAPLVVSSILATAVGRAVFGPRPVLAMPGTVGGGSGWDLLMYVVLGVLTGAVSVLYSRGVWRVHDWLARLSDWQRVLLAGLLVGALDVLFRADLWGHGHEALNLAIISQRGTLFLVGLTAAKLVATALTLAASGAGGVFTPALFLGATFGGAFAGAVHSIVPGLPVSAAAVAMVGMAGVVAGATHAPLTAIMMVFEMTGDYGLILPLMLTAMLSYVVAKRLWSQSIYTEWLARRGVHLTQGADAVILGRLPVAECLDRAVDVIPEHATLDEARAQLASARLPLVPVVDAEGHLRGMLSPQVLAEAAANGAAAAGVLIAGDIAITRYEPLTPDSTLLAALRLFARYDVPVLPVVSSRHTQLLAGVVTRAQVWTLYDSHLAAAPH